MSSGSASSSLGREVLADLDHLLGGLAGGRAADLGRLRAVRAGAAGDGVRVALDHGDLLDRDPEALGRDLRERRLVALALRERAGLDDRLAVGGDLDRAELASR